jgi:PAS domain S-box-containing protein
MSAPPATDRLAILEELFESTLAGFWDWDIAAGTEYLSPRFKRMFGYADDEMENRPEAWQALILPEDLGPLFAAFERHVASRGREPFFAEARFRHKDGSIVWVTRAGKVVAWSPEGAPLRAVGCHIDITARMRQEEVRTEALERLQSSALHVPGCIIEWEQAPDGRGRVPYASDPIRDLFGVDPEAVATDDAVLWARVLPEDLSRLREGQRDAAARLLPWHATFRVQPAPGRVKWIEGYATPTRLPDGGVRWHGYLQDVTPRQSLADRLTTQVDLLRTVAEVATALAGASTDAALDAAVLDALARLAGPLGAHRSYHFRLERRGSTLTCTHEWTAPGEPRAFAAPARFALQRMPWVAQQLLAGAPVLVPLIDELPSGAGRERAAMRARGTRSLLCVATRDATGQPNGFLGFEGRQEGTGWTVEHLSALNSVAHLVGAMLDRRAAERRVARTVERTNQLLDRTRTVLFETGPDGCYRELSPSFTTITGYPVEQWTGRSYLDLVPETERERVYAAVAPLLQRGDPLDGFVAPACASDGSRIWLETTGVPLYTADGELDGFRGSAVDVTARHEAERERSEMQRLLEESQRLARIGSWSLDLATGTITVTEEFHRIIGSAPGHGHTITYDGFMACVHPDDRPSIDAAYAASVRAGRGGATLEYRLRRQDTGVIVHVRGDFVHEHDADGRVRRSVGTLQDITDLVTATAAREALTAQLVQAQKMESVGRLAGGVAHDFNNMLNVILGHTELALHEVDPAAPLAADLHAVRDAAVRSAEITRQLLAFARRQPTAPRVLDLNAAIEGTLKMLRRLIGEDVTLAWEPGGGLWAVRLDPAQLDQVLANLCVNARDAMVGPGTVTLRTRNVRVTAADAGRDGLLPGDYVRLEVQDTGPGIPDDVRPHVFEPFFTTKEAGRGTGLGLSTVFGIVSQHGGHIDVVCPPAGGTCFAIHLPRTMAELQVVAAAPEAPAPGGTETVLLVEDEVALLRMAATMLRGLGYAVLTAEGPSEAERLVAAHDGPLHLLLTDVVMPERPGTELADTLRQRVPGLRTVFMSGYAGNWLESRGVDPQRERFLAKPFTVRELAATVRAALDG